MIEVEIQSSTTEEHEELTLELLDMETGSWRRFEPVGRTALVAGWSRALFSGTLPALRPEQIANTSAIIADRAKADVEIIDTYVMVDGERTTLVKERRSFVVCVKVLFRQAPEVADVGIKFSRGDGVYVFWQSSGLSGVNLYRPKGEKTVQFHFEPNQLGQGEYYLSVGVCNGWNYPQNYPYTQVFARALNATTFRIAPEMRDLDFGVLNCRVRVEVVSGETEAASAQAVSPAAE